MSGQLKKIVSIVIPVFNTVESLGILYGKIKSVFQKNDLNCEIIFVDDRSTNIDTWQELKRIQRSASNVTIIRLKENAGQHNAILCGLKHSKGKYVIVMDDDLQHDADDIPRLLDMKNHDVVYAHFPEKKHHVFRSIGSQLRAKMFKIQNKQLKHIRPSNFILINRKIVDKLVKINTKYVIIGAMLFSLTDDIVKIEIKHNERAEGKSGYTIKKMIRLFIKSILFQPGPFVRYFFLRGLIILSAGFLLLYSGGIFESGFEPVLYVLSFIFSLLALLLILFSVFIYFISEKNINRTYINYILDEKTEYTN